MLEYTGKYWKAFQPLLKRSLKDRYGADYAKHLLSKGNGIYRELLTRADDVGKDNPMASNLYEALIFVAIWKTAEGKMNAEDLESVVGDVLGFPPMKLMGLYLNFNKPSGVRKMSKMLHKSADWLEKHHQYKEVSWDFHFDESRNREGVYYHFTQCPINTMARREGFLEILPILCDVDFKTASLMHAHLHREHTLASGGEICDYLYTSEKH